MPLEPDRPRILLVGPSVRAFAQSATRAGYRVIAVDDFGDLDLAECADEVHPTPADADGFERLFRQIAPDAWCYGGGWENKPALVECLSRVAPLWGTGAGALRVLRDPFVWTKELRLRGFEVPDVRPFEELPASLAEERSGGRRWLSKRIDGANGSHVHWASEESGEAASADPAPGERRYLQEFVEGQVESASFTAAVGGISFLGACRQIIGAKELGASGFGFAGAVGFDSLSHVDQVFFLDLGGAIAAFSSVRGFFGVDGVRRSDGSWLPIEINPRYAASMETLEALRASSSSFDLHAADCSGQPAPKAFPRLPGCFAKGIVYARQELSLSFDLPAWRRFETLFPGVRLADLPRPGTLSRPGDPVLTLLVPGSDVDEAHAALLAAGSRVHEELVRRFS